MHGSPGVKLHTLKSSIQAMPSAGPKTIQDGSWRTEGMSAAARGYDYAWRKRRADQLRAFPLCAYCLEDGIARVATVADHITPHRGDPVLFAGPLMSLCADCHNGRKAKEEAELGLR